MPLFDLALPFNVFRRATLIIEVASEGQSKTFIQATLIEEVRFFEGGEIAGQEGRAREEDRSFHFVGGGMRLSGCERRWYAIGKRRFNGSCLDGGGGTGGSTDLMEACTADWCTWSWANQREIEADEGCWLHT